jgi:hypothetical protein
MRFATPAGPPADSAVAYGDRSDRFVSVIEVGIPTILFGVALGLRLVTAPLFGASVSTDEYRYALIAREWGQLVHGLSSLSWDDLVIYHPLVPWLAGFLKLLLTRDELTIGRGLQLTFNASLAPLVFLLVRRLGVDPIAAGFAGLVMAIAPSVWGMSVAFWPDSQLAALCALTLIGLILSVRRRRVGWVIGIVGLAAAFLTKEHIFILMLPTAAVMCVLAVAEKVLSARSATFLLMGLTVGLLVALVASVSAPLLPRAAVVWLLVGRSATPLVEDGLPIQAQAMEEAGARSWSSSALSAVLEGRVQLARIADGLGLDVWGPSLAAAGLAGAAAQLIRVARHRRGQVAVPEGTGALWLPKSVAALGLVGVTAIFVWQLTASERPPGVVWIAAAAVVGISSAVWRPLDIVPYWALGGLTAYALGTIAFFMLGHEILPFLTRYILPAFPVFALFMGLGLRDLIALVTSLVAGVPRWSLVLICGALLTAATPGGPLRLGGLAVLTAAAAMVAWRTWRTDARGIPALLAATAAGLVAVAGTPTLTTIARARDFKGYPDDRLYQVASGPLRTATFEQAEPWLRENVRQDHVVLTSKPYPVAWHSQLGFAGFRIERFWDERAADRRPYLLDSLLRDANYDWIIEFNQFAVQTNSPEGALFDEDYRWLLSRPYLREAYATRDAQGRILLYAFQHFRE